MDLTYFAYKGFIDSWIGSADCVDFLKAIMPEGFCESIYDDFWKKYRYEPICFIKSFIKMCGFAKQEIPQFDRFDNNDYSNRILYGHNDLYRFEIEYRFQITYNNIEIRFYRNDGTHFLTLKTYYNRSGSEDTVERYDWLVRECYAEDSNKPRVFSIGECTGRYRRYGFYVIETSTLYFVSWKHEETLSPDEKFDDFYESYQKQYSNEV